MKSMLVILFALFAAAAAFPQTEVGCILDREIRFEGMCNYGGSNGTGGMPVNGSCDFPHRAYAVFDMSELPSEFSGARLELFAHAYMNTTSGSCQVVAIGCEQIELDWEIDFDKPYFVLGTMFVPSELFELVEPIDVSDAITRLRDAGSQYVVFRFSTTVPSSSDISIATSENTEFGGPRLVFDTSVSNESNGLDDIKSMFR